MDSDSLDLETVESQAEQGTFVHKLEIIPFEGEEIEIPVETDGSQQGTPGKSRSAETVCLEPGCNFKCKRIPRLRHHLSDVHNFQQPLQSFEFQTEEEFKIWLSKIESDNHCSFMRRRGWQKNKSGSRSACFYCNRGGAYTSNASKKQSKQQGTCKTGVECTSSLKVTIWSPPHFQNLVQVEAYLQHYGHNFELGHTRIHMNDRKDIETKLRNGVSRHKILDEIRGSLDQTSDLNRRHLISLQDIYNIEKRSGLKGSRGRYSSEAGITAQAWIEGMQQSEENPVLLIKYQQEAATEKYKCLADNDFILVLQTPLQAKMLQKYGPRQFMCVDVTQGTIPSDPKEIHGFLLFALEVLVSSEEGNKEPYPVAWCVSNRRDKDILRIFFECVKDNLGGQTLTPAYLFLPSVGISGGEDWFDIWTQTFGAGPRKLMSSWHVMEEWRQSLQTLSPAVYASMSEKERVLGNLETVIRETSADHFVKLLDECIADLNTNPVAKNFGSYIAENYTSQAELWASAYRTESANRTDMYLDAFHARLSKHIYHEALKRKQLDVLVKTLMKYTRDNVLTKLRNLHKGKSESHLRSRTAKTHKESEGLPLDHVEPVEGNRNEWSVRSIVSVVDCDGPSIKQMALQNTVKVLTKRLCTARTRCSLRCSSCEACTHHMSCTCRKNDFKDKEATSLGEQVMCVHMHQVCRFLWERRRQTVDSLLRSAITIHERNSSFEWIAAIAKSETKPILVHVAPGDVTSSNSDAILPSADGVTNDRTSAAADVKINPFTSRTKKTISEFQDVSGNQRVKSQEVNSLVTTDDTVAESDGCSQSTLEPDVCQRVKLPPKSKIIKLELTESNHGFLFIPNGIPAKVIKR